MKNVKFLFILSLMGALSSCEWHADLYNRYADENGIAVKCGLCDGKLLDEIGACSGEWRPLEMIDLGNGNYIRKLEDDKYVCGSYDDVLSVVNETAVVCDSEIIEKYKDEFKYSLCRTGNVCTVVNYKLDDNTLNKVTLAMCSIDKDITCGDGVVNCYCTIDDNGNYISCDGELGNDKSLVCLKPGERDMCGAKICDDIIKRGCNRDEDCIFDNSVDNYVCNCHDGFVRFENECLNPYSTKSCGVTSESKEIVKCSENMICNGDECVCSHGFEKCDGVCIDITNDEFHCGGCYDKCSSNEICKNRICMCNEGYARCDSEICVANDNKHCGAHGSCNIANPDSENYKGSVCGINEICKDGTICSCIDGMKKLVVNGIEQCRDTTKDNECCGKACDKCEQNIGDKCGPCNVADGEACIDGICKPLICDKEQIKCNGSCKLSDEEHVIVDDSGCKCVDEWCAKDNNVANGCNERINTLNHCGGCEIACDSGYTTCDNGKCSCVGNETECINPNNETEVICVDFSKENKYHLVSCDDCATGWTRNDQDDWRDGCQRKLEDDDDNCGSVNHKCSEQIINAESFCRGARCYYVKCISDEFEDCDHDESNGCEINVSVNKEHCGGCNNKCDYSCFESTSEGVAECEVLCENAQCCFTGELLNNDAICCSGTRKYKYSYGGKFTNGSGKEEKCKHHTHYGCFSDENYNNKHDKGCWSLL